MAEIKIVIGTKEGKSYQMVVNEQNVHNLYGKKIGDKLLGSETGIPELDGYEFEIRGGSDESGFPMRKDLEGTGKRRILSRRSLGFRLKRKGLRVKKSVAENTVSERTAQLNLVVLKEGKRKLGSEPEPAQNSPEAKPAEEKAE